MFEIKKKKKCYFLYAKFLEMPCWFFRALKNMYPIFAIKYLFHDIKYRMEYLFF